MKKILLTSLCVATLTGCSGTGTDVAATKELTVEQQNQEIALLADNFPENAFWQSCEEYRAFPDKLTDYDKELEKNVYKAFDGVAIAGKPFIEHFGTQPQKDCNVCTSKEAENLAKASRHYIELLNRPYFTQTKMTMLQLMNFDNYFEKAMLTVFEMERICSGKNFSKEDKAKIVGPMLEQQQKTNELFQKLQKQYKVAKSVENADDCGIMPCRFIKQAAEASAAQTKGF